MAYGVVCNINCKSLISKIAKIVYDLVFKNGEPTPHVLLRDYARGVLEHALHLELLPDSINPDQFRPPYKSNWPIENPSQKDIDELGGDKNSSSIKRSLMHLGDFGNYTMNCIHQWSPTPLSEPTPKTGYEYKKEFADNYLKGRLKEQYLEKINSNELDLIQSMSDKEREREDKKENSFIEKITKGLGEEEREHFRWFSGLSNDSPAIFSKRWAQRWVCKRAYDLGWDKELFGVFEESCRHGRTAGSTNEHMERVGKKYQWIALHELLARFSDNVHWLGMEYNGTEDKEYHGPWQMFRRDIDPTIWIRSNAEGNSYHSKRNAWWQGYKFPLDEIIDKASFFKFILSKEIIPEFPKIIEVRNPRKKANLLALKGFWTQLQEVKTDKSPSGS